MNNLWYTEQFQDLLRLGVRVRETLHSEQSAFQRIDVFDTDTFGRTLALDGMFMTSEEDEFFYHEMLVQPPMVVAENVERILVIGGGDGGTVREILRHADVKEVVMAEIDGAVVDVCKKYLPSIGSAWNDPRLDVRIIDGIDYVKSKTEAPFDLIFLDGSDPVGPAEGLFNQSFYEGVRAMLKPDGLFALQSESPLLMDTIFVETQQTLCKVFTEVRPYFGTVPLYGCGTWSWTLCGESFDPNALHKERVDTIEKDSKIWSPALHKGAFTVPGYVRAKLGL